MARINVTIPDADLAAVNARWAAGGVYADFAARLQAFADEETRAAKIEAAQRSLATETAKGVDADEATLKEALYVEYRARVS